MYEDKLIQGSHKRAQYLRRHQTAAETLLWKKLRNRGFQGLKFRRQAPIGQYVADFLCVEKRIVIEVDGWVHDFNEKTDAIKTIHLQQKDLIVLRFTNEQVQNALGFVLAEIARAAGIPLLPEEPPGLVP